MSCAPTKVLPVAWMSTAEEAGEIMRFQAEVADGLHALAQPLTILRGAIGALASQPPNEAASRRYMEMSSRQVERICDLFTALQDLLIARRADVQCTLVNLHRLLADACEEAQDKLGAQGITIVLHGMDERLSAVADAARMHLALAAVFSAAQSISSVGDRIEVRAVATEQSVQINIASERALDRRLNAAERLSLAAADAAIRSQGGSLILTTGPFKAQLTVPKEMSIPE